MGWTWSRQEPLVLLLYDCSRRFFLSLLQQCRGAVQQVTGSSCCQYEHIFIYTIYTTGNWQTMNEPLSFVDSFHCFRPSIWPMVLDVTSLQDLSGVQWQPLAIVLSQLCFFCFFVLNENRQGRKQQHALNPVSSCTGGANRWIQGFSKPTGRAAERFLSFWGNASCVVFFKGWYLSQSSYNSLNSCVSLICTGKHILPLAQLDGYSNWFGCISSWGNIRSAEQHQTFESLSKISTVVDNMVWNQAKIKLHKA